MNKILSLLDKKKRLYLIGLCFYSLFLSFLEIFSLTLAIPIAGLVTGEVEIKSYKLLLDFFSRFDKDDLAVILLLFFCLTYFLKTILFINFNYQIQKFTNFTCVEISKNFFKKYLDLPFISLSDVSHSKIIRNLTQEVWNFSSLLYSVISIFSESLFLIFIAIFLLFLNWKITLILFIVVLFVTASYTFFYKTKIKEWSNKRQQTRSSLIKNLYDAINSPREIRLYFRQKYFLNKFIENQSYLSKYEVNINSAIFAPRFLIELSIIMCVLFIFIYNYRFNNIENLLSLITVFVLSSTRIVPSISKIISSIQNYRYNIFSANLFSSELTKKNKITKDKNKIRFINEENFFKKNITFSNVTFSYNSKKKIFDNINIKINKGDQVLLLGKSGIGKSTFLDILVGFLQPKLGKVLIDNKYNILSYDKLWKSKIGYVSQNNFLSNDSLINNITFSENDKNTDLNYINNILKKMDFHKEVDAFSEKLKTNLGERGNKISGGQLQRVAIARALYKKPELLILDEGTSALDGKNEKIILDYIRSLNITLINCAHKYSGTSQFNKVFEISNGKVKNIK
jgi:ABC-type multidrug transport system fused ATPase/permease subunit